MTVKLIDPNNAELMAISGLERNGNELVIRGKIYGSMPIKARLTPQEVRNIFGLLNASLLFFIVSMLFRRDAAADAKKANT